ncbi:hypothetical protein [Kitasatospora sp. NPDC004289]
MTRRHIRRSAVSLLAAAALAGIVPAPQASAESTPICRQDPMYTDDIRVALDSGARLTAGQTRTDHTGSTALRMQPDGNLVLSLVNSTGGPDHAMWSSGTWGNPGAYAEMQADGNLVVYRQDGTALWSTRTWGSPGAKAYFNQAGNLYVLVANVSSKALWESHTTRRAASFCDADASRPDHQGELYAGSWAQSASVWLIMQPDGNLVIYRKRDDAPIWSSGTWHMYPWVLNMQADGNLVMRYQIDAPVWSTGTWGNPGARAVLQDDGNFVVYRQDGRPLWSTGTWGAAG